LGPVFRVWLHGLILNPENAELKMAASLGREKIQELAFCGIPRPVRWVLLAFARHFKWNRDSRFVPMYEAVRLRRANGEGGVAYPAPDGNGREGARVFTGRVSGRGLDGARGCEAERRGNRASAHRQDKDKRGVKRATSLHRSRSPHAELRTKTCTTKKIGEEPI